MWQETKEGLYREFSFKDFAEAFSFMKQVAHAAEAQNHHPIWKNDWNKVEIWLNAHSEGGAITAKDHQLAETIDKILETQGNKLADVIEKVERVKMFADGGSRGNPGPSASGLVVLDMNDKVLVEKGVYLGVTTNNQAEYTALKLGLEEAHRMGAKEVEVYMDSLLVVNQMKGIFKIRNRDLWPIHDAIKQLATQFKRINYQHVPRELNKLADAAVNKALDKELGITL
ncbi:MAG TPA: 4a-hydroxytetrahydrobiopterin dehydratase [Candidatus Saccharimonadales bacterium]|nr:4a-hydroxytetrahydrobiopterin dehydratase [Candidatus Saccharimonadales bacterium]